MDPNQVYLRFVTMSLWKVVTQTDAQSLCLLPGNINGPCRSNCRRKAPWSNELEQLESSNTFEDHESDESLDLLRSRHQTNCSAAIKSTPVASHRKNIDHCCGSNLCCLASNTPFTKKCFGRKAGHIFFNSCQQASQRPDSKRCTAESALVAPAILKKSMLPVPAKGPNRGGFEFSEASTDTHASRTPMPPLNKAIIAGGTTNAKRLHLTANLGDRTRFGERECDCSFWKPKTRMCFQTDGRVSLLLQHIDHSAWMCLGSWRVRRSFIGMVELVEQPKHESLIENVCWSK